MGMGIESWELGATLGCGATVAQLGAVAQLWVGALLLLWHCSHASSWDSWSVVAGMPKQFGLGYGGIPSCEVLTHLLLGCSTYKY